MHLALILALGMAFSARAERIPRPPPIGNKILHAVQPIFEGLYDLDILCPKTQPNCEARRHFRTDRISVVNSRLNTGTWVTISATYHGDIDDRYMESEVNEEGNELIATPNARFGTSGRFSYIEMHFHAETGGFTGKLIAADSMDDYEIVGTPIETGNQFKKTLPPAQVPAEAVIGLYKGNLGRLRGTLNIKQMPDGHMIGVFDTEEKVGDAPLMRMPFSSGDWHPDSGLLYLTFNLPKLSGQGLMLLAFRSYQGGSILLEGFEIAGARDNKTRFLKIR